MEELEDRITELEIRFTHQASQMEELNAELIGCYRRIEELEKETERMREMLKSLAPGLVESPDE